MTFTPITPGSLNWDVPVNAQFTNDNSRLDTIDGTLTFVNNVLTIFSQQLAAIQTNNQGATDQDLISWTYDPVMSVGSVIPNTAGILYLTKFIILTDTTMNNIIYTVNTAGATLTAGQNFVAVYDSTGVRKAVSGDQTTNFGTTGTKTAATGSVALPAGTYYVAFLSNGTTTPQFRGVLGIDTMLNAGLTTAAPRFARFGSGQTVTPASFTMSSSILNSGAPWAAIT